MTTFQNKYKIYVRTIRKWGYIITDLLLKLAFKNKDVPRGRYGNFASLVGIVCNILLALAKGAAGFLFGSVAIIADAVNNLSDAATSVISLVGFAISDKPADEDHPYGHARVEYISCMIVAFVILSLGLSLLKSSISGIFNPNELDTGLAAISVLCGSIIVKLWLSGFFKKLGKKINSSVLIANSKDSLNDVISTGAVLLTTLIAYFWKINLDAYAGCLVSLFILYAGYEVLKDTMNNLLGTMPDSETVKKITDKLYSYDGVMGIHDLVVHSYGPDKHFATVHVEVSDKVDVLVSHDMIDNIERDFSSELGINLVIHLDPIITDDEDTNKMRDFVKAEIEKIYPGFDIHDFRMVKGDSHTNLIFDVVAPPAFKATSKEIIEKISEKIKEEDSSLFCVITVDRCYVPER